MDTTDQHDTTMLIAHFSGTGNTAHVAAYLKKVLTQLPVTVKLEVVERHRYAYQENFDILVIGFPVYGCAPPTVILDYIDLLPHGNGRGAFVFCTKGFFAGGAPHLAMRRFAQRGYVPLGAVNVQMPGSDALAFSDKHSRRAASAFNKDYTSIEEIDRFITKHKEIIASIIAGSSPRFHRYHSPLGMIASMSSVLSAAVISLFVAFLRRKLRADERCISCGLCERICPVGNIRLLNGRPQFDRRCILCLRCLHNCPREAIQIGRVTINKTRWLGPEGEGYPPARLRGINQVQHGLFHSTAGNGAES